jgi:hypothetical protein
VETYLLRSVLEPSGRTWTREILEERQRKKFSQAATEELFGEIPALNRVSVAA